MTVTKRLNRNILFTSLVGLGLSVGGQAQALILPPPDPGQDGNSLLFNEFIVYSLPLLNFNAGFGDISPGDPFFVRSAGNEINTAVVIGSSPGGRRDNDDISMVNIDDAYDTPNSIPGGSTFATFTTDSESDPGGAGEFGGDLDITWDVTLDVLNGFLDANQQLAFFFNLNEENTNTNDPEGRLNDGQDMLAWLEITLEDLDGVVGDAVFTLSGDITSPLLNQNRVESGTGNPSLDGLNMAWVHGQICVDSNTGDLLTLGPCTDLVNPPAGATTVNQNLGSDIAAFALFNEELDFLVRNSMTYDVMHVDLRMSRIDNGFEQLFIRGVEFGETREVPLPGTLLLLGIGLIGLSLRWRA